MTSVAEEKVVIEEGEVSPSRIVYKSVCIKFKLPYGKLSEIASLMKFINSKFKHMEIVMEISAKGGNLEENEYKDKIEEALKQAGAEIEVEKLE